MIARQLNLFFNTLLFYTRIRVPKSVVCNEQTLSDAFRYFPLVGILLASLCTGLYLILDTLLPREISILAVMVFNTLLTGAFHEDGLADFFDGFGAGHTKEHIMRIMKDSHIGTYGVIALILALGLRYQLLLALPEQLFIPALIAAGAISRFYPVLIVRISTYARTEASKASHSALGLTRKNLCIAAVLSLPLAFCFGWIAAFVLLLAGFLCCFALHAYTRHWIGGYTGDCLGALQQFEELLFYTILLALLPTLSLV